MRAVVTGFEGFAGKINPSGLIAKSLDGAAFGELFVTGLELPEDFKTLPSIMRDLIRKTKPDILISTGWDYISKFKIEKVALNIQSSEFGDKIVPDNLGNSPSGEEVIARAPTGLRATLPAEKILRQIQAAGLPAYLSYSAGTHCCNTVMYSGIYYSQKANPNSLSGFIHIPPTPEMKLNRGKSGGSIAQSRERKAIECALVASRDFLAGKSKGKR
jgi:pyroglutamyl-peptidase